MNCNSGADQKLVALNREIVSCVRCPRLVNHCQEVARVKRRAYRDQDYYGKPVPSFGDAAARLLILGLAPGAHGANRTGRMFTGDRSGEFLFRSLHKAGFASQPQSLDGNDGLQLHGAWITASAHCAPPDNKPSPGEIRNCRSFFLREMDLLTNLSLIVVLGKVAMDTYLAVQKDCGKVSRMADFRFGHNVLFEQLQPALLCSYHPSQQNTSTGKLTQAMLDEVFDRAAEFIRSAQDRAAFHP